MNLTPELAKKIGDKLGIDWSVISPETLMKGAEVEMEHKDLFPEEGETIKNWVIACKIANVHLKESPKYYVELDKMEKKLKESIEPLVNEMRYPPKALNFNDLKDADGFWGWGINDAANEAGLRPIPSPFKRIADVILWLNMAAQSWQRMK